MQGAADVLAPLIPEECMIYGVTPYFPVMDAVAIRRAFYVDRLRVLNSITDRDEWQEFAIELTQYRIAMIDRISATGA